MSIEHPTGRDPGQTPAHYRHPSGLEPWHIVIHWPHPMASAFEYVWRVGKKGDPFSDFVKTIECLQVEAYRRRQLTTKQDTPFLLRNAEQMRIVWSADGGARSDALFAIFDAVNESNELKLEAAIQLVLVLAVELVPSAEFMKLNALVSQ